MNHETMKCKNFLTKIELSDDLSGFDVELSSHAETCNACNLALMDRTVLQSLLSELSPVAAPNDFEWRLRARLQFEGPDHSRTSGVKNWLWRMQTTAELDRRQGTARAAQSRCRMCRKLSRNSRKRSDSFSSDNCQLTNPMAYFV